MKKPVLALVVLVVFAVLWSTGYVFLFRDAESAEETAFQPTTTAPVPELPTADPASLLATEGPERNVAAPRTEAVFEEVSAERFGEWSRDGAIEVRGRIAIPAGVPADPTLNVLVLETNLSAAALYGNGGVATPLGRRDRSKVHAALLAVEMVEPDGSFRVEFPAGTKRGWLAVEGRYLFSAPCEEVQLDGEETALVVYPQVGGRLVGRVLYPEGTDDPDAHSRHAEVKLVPDTSTFSMAKVAGGMLFDRAAIVHAGGNFELRAVDAGRAYEAMVACEGFATHVNAGIQLAPGRDTIFEARMGAGIALRGRVIDENDDPVLGAGVRVVRPVLWGLPGGSEFATGTTDTEGAFLVPHVPAEKVVLVARHGAFLESAPRNLDLAKDAPPDEILLRVARGAVLAGTVRTPDGAPAARVRIQVKFDPNAMMGPGALNAMRGAEGEARSAADGTFEVGGLGKGPFQLTAVAKASEEPDAKVTGRVQVSGLTPNTTDLDLVLASPPRVLGRVEDEAGEPVTAFRVSADTAGAIMYLMGDARRAEFSDAEGRFEMDGLYEGPWQLTVRAEDYGPSETITVDLPRPADSEPLLFVLRPPAGVAGLVVDPSGRGIAAAMVSIEVDADKTMARLAGRLELPQARCDEEGAYLLQGVPEGEVGVVATHPDYASSAPVTTKVVGGTVVEGVVLTLRQGAILTGEVFGKDGDPAAGVTLIVQKAATFQPTMATTTAAGTFRLESLDPGSYTVTCMMGAIQPPDDRNEGGDGGSNSVLANLFGNMLFSTAELKDGEETHIVLGAPPADPIRVHGTISHDGEPVPNLMVTFMPEGTSGFQGLKMEQTDGEGRYEVTLDAPGPVLVTVAAMGANGGMQNNSIEFSRTIPEGEEHRLDLDLPVGRISGTVFASDGKPLPQARITLTAEGGIAYGTMWGGQYAESTTDGDGKYELPYLRPGTYQVAAGGALMGGLLGTKSGEGRQVRGDLRVKKGQHLEGIDFRLPKPGDITGTVVDATGAPVPQAAIFVRDAEGNLLERLSMNVSGPDGKFRYAAVSPGEYTITARAGDLASIEGDIVRVTAGQTTDLRVSMVGGTMLLVTVTDRSGAEVRARVSVKDERGREVNGMLSLTEVMGGQRGLDTAEQRVGPLPPGRYEVTAVADDGREVAKPVTLAGQPERRLRVRLK